ncbi:hypothetical protein ACJVDH_08825 [Pedobacter sp. AW1-32]|uniref:hypothetical protein n=1 Tax=Pedobacter sp. AW1-32 TaxID=3383026 RepID=UPI003FEF913A
MKKLILIALIASSAMLTIERAHAQINLNVNIGSQPLWGPTGYDHAEYYYLPDINSYYYVPSGQYVVQNGNSWSWVNALPSQYSNFDLYGAYKVVMNTDKPYLQNKTHTTQYKQYKNNKGKQPVIRDSKDEKYNDAKNNSKNNSKNNQGRNQNSKGGNNNSKKKGR